MNSTTTVTLVFVPSTECWVLLDSNRQRLTLDKVASYGRREWALSAAKKHCLVVIE